MSTSTAIDEIWRRRKVIEEIARERQRQIEKEKWSTYHDDEHQYGELSAAAACYSLVASAQARGANTSEFTEEVANEMGWPWNDEWWKPKDPRRNLIRAAALIVAEIERIDRAEAAKK